MRLSSKIVSGLVNSRTDRGTPLAVAGSVLAILLLSSGARPALANAVGGASSPELITVCVNGDAWTDGGFEATNSATLANPNYVTTSLKFGIGPSTPNGTPLCNIGNASCMDGSGAPPPSNSPRTGNSWAWFGGNDGVPTPFPEEVASAAQTINFPAGASSVTLRYYLRIGVVTSPFSDTLEVQVDGVTQQSWTEPSAPEANYTQRNIDLTAFADGAAHTVKFLYTQHGNDPNGVLPNSANFDVDDVTLDIVCAQLTPVALAVDPSGNGVLEPGEIVSVKPTWKNDAASPIDLIGESSNYTGPLGPTYNNPDTAADYGNIAAGASAQCTTDCYSVQVTAASRPVTHWDTTIDEAAGAATKTWTLHVGESFTDVPDTYPFFYGFIETIFHKGITDGCIPGPAAAGYCPNLPTIRSHMAKFLLRSKFGAGYVPPDCTGLVFDDVPCTGGEFDPWIEDLHAKGVTNGCSVAPPLYCPNDPVLREQMAKFLLLTLEGSGYVPPDCTGLVFDDVPCTGGEFDPYIEELASHSRGITNGCSASPPLFCPQNSNTRAEMAKFLSLTFGLLLYGP